MSDVELTKAVTWLSLIHTAKLIAAFLVAIGVAVEFLGDWVARPFERVVDAARETELNRLSTETATARAQIADAQRRAAEANAQAVKAQLELEKFRSPRTLSTHQSAQVTAKVAQFAGTTFDVASNNAHEPLALVDQIERTLVAAGWKELNWTSSTTISRNGKPSLGLAVETGVSVQVDFSKQATLLPIAKALATALSAEGIAARDELMPTPQTVNQDSIHIVVGEKPRDTDL